MVAINDGNKWRLNKRAENQPSLFERMSLVVREHHIHLVSIQLIEQRSILMVLKQNGYMVLVIEQHGG